ncbi:MAG TPA: hypothetical protein PKL31_04535, partial [Fulvivirga sp.]|nr:hypothetical protein [Fulvivirga sp.]
MKFKLILTGCILVFSLLTSIISVAQCGFTGLNPNYCTTDSPVTLSENESGGTFSGSGITGNTFDPAAAGPGTHTISYTNPDFYTIDQTGTYSFVGGGGWTRFNSGGSDLEGFDDLVSAATPIGFTFNFFGNNYTNFYASSNGNIGFTSYSEFGGFTSRSITDTGDPDNFIALARADLDPSNSGGGYRIQYKVTGVAPNRILIVSYENIARYNGGSGGDPITTQVKLFETTNVIEIHSTTISSVAYDQTLQGIENATGTIGFVPAGRNNTFNWGVTNDFVSFTPCTDSQMVTVTEAAVVAAGGDTEICEGVSYNIKVPSSISGGASDGTWSAITGGSDGTFDGGTTWSTSTTFTPGATDIANGSVTLRLTSDVPGGACGAVSDDVVVTITAAPLVDASG